jgi:hypothetical protein
MKLLQAAQDQEEERVELWAEDWVEGQEMEEGKEEHGGEDS